MKSSINLSAVFHYLTCNSSGCNVQLKLWGLYEGVPRLEARYYSARWGVPVCTKCRCLALEHVAEGIILIKE